MRIHLLRIHKRISCVYTRDLLCMHKSVVHAQEIFVYTQEILLCIHNKSHKYTNFVVNTHYLIFRRLFCRKKTPGGHAAGLAPGVRGIQSPGLEPSNHPP